MKTTHSIAVATIVLFSLAAAVSAQQTATGTVFLDQNQNGKRDNGEPGLVNVRVSNQREVVKTDAQGRYRLPVSDDTILFVVKPRGYMTPVNGEKLPRFYYVHKPGGSPLLTYSGVAPTGPLPASVDFPLVPQKESDDFRVLLFGDTQARNEKELEFMERDVIPELIGVKAAFGVTLGDVVFDDLSIYGSHNKKIAPIGLPWYNVLGNHDMNYDAKDDTHSDETFENTYGPAYYSYDYGSTHFVVLDGVTWLGAQPGGTGKSFGGKYIGGFGRKQLNWLKNDLAQVSRDQLVVLFMHIPLTEPADVQKSADSKTDKNTRFIDADRRELYTLLSNYPNSLTVSAHTHFQEHSFITAEDGWKGPQPHHHFNAATVCGSWWSGQPDERGIPHTTMRDGTPNGYSFLSVKGNKYSIQYKAARQPASYQMNIHAPDEIETGSGTEVVVNVFAGSERSKVEMRLGENGAWIPLQKEWRQDPFFSSLKELEASIGNKKLPGRKLPALIDSPHVWSGQLPAATALGTHHIYVRTTDMFGQQYSDRRMVRVVASQK